MFKVFSKTLCLLLTLVLVTNMLPLSVLAQNLQNGKETATHHENAEIVASTKDVQIV